MKTVLIISLALFCQISRAQTNVALLHQLVDNSKSEHKRQLELRDQQGASSATEEINRSQMSTLKSRYRDIQRRFSTLSTAVNALQVGIECEPLIDKISRDQQKLFKVCQGDPLLIAMALESEVDLLDRSQMLVRFVYGLIVSVGELNAMKISDRRMLLGFVLDELRAISSLLNGLVIAVHSSKLNAGRAVNLFPSMFDRDKQAATSVLSKIRQVRK